MKNTYPWRRKARTAHRCWPDRCGICGRFLTRRAVDHSRQCAGHAAAELLTGRCA